MTVALGLALGASALACAPRQTRTHYDRWAEQDAQRRAEQAAEEAAEAALKASVTPKAAATSASASSARDENVGTPPIRTATAAAPRVIRPADEPSEDEDVVY